MNQVLAFASAAFFIAYAFVIVAIGDVGAMKFIAAALMFAGYGQFIMQDENRVVQKLGLAFTYLGVILGSFALGVAIV